MKKLFLHLKPLAGLPWLPVWLVPLVLFSPLLLSGRPMFWGAVFLQFTPWRMHAFNQILEGHLPLWNSLSGMGVPLAANYQSALFYPPTWLLLPFYRFGGVDTLALGETWLVVLHLIWSALGMVFLLRQLGCGKFAQTVGALAFSLSGYLVTRASFLSINATVAWLPWVLLCCERLLVVKQGLSRRIVIGGITVGMLLLAGHAQTAFYSLLLSACWVFYRGIWSGWKATVKTSLYWIISIIMGCGLAAIQLIPTVEYLLQSQRANEIGYEYAVNYSFLPWRFLTLLLPNLFGTPANGTYMLRADAYWEDAIYIGLLPLCLAVGVFIYALLSRDTVKEWVDRFRLSIFLMVLAILAAMIALGSYTPLFPFLYKNVPSFDLFQAPARWMIWLVLAFSVLAGFGAEVWRKPEGRWRVWLNLCLALGITICVVTVLAGWYMPSLPKAFIHAFLVFGASVVFGCVLTKINPQNQTMKGKRTPIWHWLVILFVSADLLMANWQVHPAADKELYSKAVSVAQSMQARVGGGRLYISRADLDQLQYKELFDFRDFRMGKNFDLLAGAVLPDTNLYGALASVNNFDPLIPGRFDELMTKLEKTDGKTKQQMLQRTGVSLIELLVGDQGKVRFEPLEGRARVRWVNCAVGVADGEAALAMLFNQAAQTENPQPVILENTAPEPNNCSITLYETRIIDEQSDKLTIQVTTPEEGWLVLSDTWYPGWHAWIDDQSAEIHQADFLFRAVKVPAGQHTIRMAYQPFSFWLGFGLSLLFLVLLLVLCITNKRGVTKA